MRLGEGESAVKEPVPPIVLRPSVEGRVLALLLPGFGAVVIFLLSALLSCVPLCVLMGLLLAGLALNFLLSGKHSIRFEAEQAVEQTAFTAYCYSYEGAEVLLRRSWTTTVGIRPGGLSRTAISLRRKGKVLLTVPVGWRPPEELRRAVRFLERLPISKRYL